MLNWSTYKLGKLCLHITDGEHGSVTDDLKGEYFLLSNKNIVSGKIVYDKTDRRISKGTFAKINKRTRLAEGDVVISTVGVLGKVAIINKDVLKYDFQRSVGIIKPDPIYLDNKYLYYYLNTKFVRKRINDLSKGAVQKCFFISDLKDLDIHLPKNIAVQREIAAVLSALDDKIELNNRINAQLEQMSKTLYDYWFVQFDYPNAEGKPYKSSGGEMVYSEVLKREIPKGWEVKNISKISEIVDCLHSKKPDYNFENEDQYLLQLENLMDNGLIDISKKYFVKKSDFEKWTSRIKIEEHDILITNAGRVAQTTQVSKEIISGIGRNITAIRPTKIAPTFCFLSINSVYIQQQVLNNIDQGAFFQSFNVKGIKRLNFIYPPKSLQQSFEKIAYNLRRKRELNLQQNQQLAQLRDWLLPMLMNGQVTVGEAKELVEDLGMVAEEKSDYQTN